MTPPKLRQPGLAGFVGQVDAEAEFGASEAVARDESLDAEMAHMAITTDANGEVATCHTKAMPVILTQEAEWDLWMSGAPWGEVEHLQRPLSDGFLQIVARGVRQDEAVPARAHRIKIDSLLRRCRPLSIRRGTF